MEAIMTPSGYGGARVGAGRKPSTDRKVKRSVRLSVAADRLVQAAMHGDETYSQTMDRLLCAMLAPAESSAPDPIAALIGMLTTTRTPVATIYRQLGWTRQAFERVIQTHRDRLGSMGVRLHVATKDAASGRRERYITIDGMRYSALSRDPVQK
jgi:hypothetical protein